METPVRRRPLSGSEVVRATALGILTVIAIVSIAVLVLSRSDWGREQVRRFVLRQLQDVVNGEVTIGRVRGNLLTGATIETVAIRDTAGQLFFAADTVSARYSIGELLTRKIDLRNVRIHHPLIVLDKPPGGKWNYQRIFPPSDTTKPQSVRRKGFPWIVLHQLALADGRVIVRAPWKPDRGLARAAQDSSIRDALSGKKRLRVIRSGSGFQKVVELRELNLRAPLLRITQPGFKDRLAQVTSLQTVAYPFREPPATVRDLLGNVRFNNDSVWFSNVAVRMPASQLRGAGRYTFNGGDLRVNARATHAALADFRWVLPRFPSEGGGPLNFRLEWEGTTEKYFVNNADVRTQGARLQGKFAITFADTFSIHDTDFRFTNVSTKLVEQMAPDFEPPRPGTMDGRLTIVGGRQLMQLTGDLAFHDVSEGTSHVTGTGGVGFLRDDLILRKVRLRANPLQVALIKALAPVLDTTIEPIGGVVLGDITLDGSTHTALAIGGDVTHRGRRGVSRLKGTLDVPLDERDTFTADVRGQPLALAEVGLLAPSLGLRGVAIGTIKLSGKLSNLQLATSLRLTDGGTVTANGRLDLDGRTKGYDLTGSTRLLNLGAVTSKAPPTLITAKGRAQGAGFQPATMRGAFAIDFAASTWDSVSIDSGSVRMSVANGMAEVERAMVRGASTRIDVAGTFGLVAGRMAELSYRLAIDSLGAYNQLIPGGDEPGVVRPRSALVARAITRAREDSIRVARATQVERAATGRAMPAIPLDTPRSVARSALSGRLYAAGTLRGNLQDFDVRGRLTADDLVARGNSIRTLRAEYAWTNARTPASRIAIGVEGKDISVQGFAFDTLEGRLSYRNPTGEVQLAVRQGNDRDYSARGSFTVGAQRKVRVEQLAVRMDTTTWTLARAAEVHWRPAGLDLRDVELRSNDGGALYVNGLLPTEGNANLVFDVQNFQVADIASFLQSDLAMRGILTARVAFQGTLGNPRFHGAAGLVGGNYNGSAIPDFRASFDYANSLLTTHVQAVSENRLIGLIADARLPINLAFTPGLGRRILDQPLRVDISGDSLPLDLIPAFTDAVAQIRGKAAGTFAVRGTIRRPTMAGAITWTNGSMRIVPTGMLVEGITASVRMARDTVFVDSIAGRSGRGPVRLGGRLYVGSWREPTFDLHVVGTKAEVLNNDRGRLDADIGLSLTGPFKDAYLAGLVHVRQGVGYVPESNEKVLVNPGDPTVFQVMDTSITNDRELFPTSTPLLENLRIDVDLTINRNTWLRSRDANIEMFTEDPVRIHREADALALTGVISTDRGEYTFMSKRFQVKRGSATFQGGPEMNPALQATGEFAVTLAGRQSFNIRVLIGGTLRSPKLTLESDAQPPISQSDLLSYLAFGRSSTTLLQVEGSGLSGATATGNLIGVGAAFATQRMASVAIGVMADEMEGEAAKGIGADIFNITPADVPTEIAAVESFVRTTRVEAGKYMSPYFFMAAQTQLDLQQWPGLRVEYRTPRGLRFEGSIETRYLLRPPSLAIQPIPGVTSFGAFIIREWRF